MLRRLLGRTGRDDPAATEKNGTPPSLDVTQEETLLPRIQAALDEIRPALQFDGGDAELLGWSADTGVVQLRLQGACSGCGMSEVTLQAGIERIIRERVPEVRAVVAV